MMIQATSNEALNYTVVHMQEGGT